MADDSAKPIKKAGSDRPQPIDITTRLRQTLANMIGTDDEPLFAISDTTKPRNGAVTNEEPHGQAG